MRRRGRSPEGGRGVAEHRLFDPDHPPGCADPSWYDDRPRAAHLEEYAHRGRLRAAKDLVVEATRRAEIVTVVDLGCGDGGLASTLFDTGLRVWGYDLSPQNLAGAAERGVDAMHADVSVDPIRWGDLAIVTEVLEHLVDPHGLVADIASRCVAVVASSPATETPQSHYGYHLWCWDVEGYREMFTRAGFEVPVHRQVDGFQVLLGLT